MAAPEETGPEETGPDRPPAEPASYAAAEAELESILTALEDEGVDVDQLSDHVRRARELIRWCRGQVAAAEVAVTELLEDDAAPA